MLRAYWDESGHAEDPRCRFVGMGGLVASTEGWSAFEPQWRSVLHKYGLASFHMREYVALGVKNKDEWPEERRKALMNELLQAIALAKPFVHGAVMDLSAWRALTTEERSYFRDPWFCCLQECVRLAAVHCHVDNETMETVFSDQGEFRGKAAELWAVLKNSQWPGFAGLGGYAMEEMRRVLPLQAADLVAYETVKFTSDTALPPPEKSPRPPRYPLLALLGIAPDAFIAHIDAGYLAWQLEGVNYLPEGLRR